MNRIFGAGSGGINRTSVIITIEIITGFGNLGHEMIIDELQKRFEKLLFRTDCVQNMPRAQIIDDPFMVCEAGSKRVRRAGYAASREPHCRTGEVVASRKEPVT